MLEVMDDYPIFGEVDTIYVADSEVVLFVRVMCTTSFYAHSHVYVVERTSHFRAVSVSSLYSPCVLHVRRLIIHGSSSLVIIPKFHIVKSLLI